MPFALVGSVGAAVLPGVNSAATPSFGTGEGRTAGNLLICWATCGGVATLPTPPTGWSTGVQQAGTSCSASVFYKIAVGTEGTTVTVPSVAGGTLKAQLAEYTGAVLSSPADQSGGAAGTTSPIVATAGGADAAAGNLVVAASHAFYSAAATKTLGDTLNNGATAISSANNATSTANHYSFCYGVTTGNGGADSESFAYTTASITGAVSAVCSFKAGVEPTLKSYTETSWTAGATTVTTASVSWAAGDVVVLVAGTEGQSSATLSLPTHTGSNLGTVTQQQLHNESSNCGGAIWSAIASGTGSGTFSSAVSAGSEIHGLGVFVFSGSSGVGNSAISATTARTVSLTPTAADGSIVWAVFDWSASATQTITPTPITHTTTAPGPNAVPHSAVVGTSYTFYVAELDDQTSAGAVSYGIGGAGTGPFTIVAVEVKSAATVPVDAGVAALAATAGMTVAASVNQLAGVTLAGGTTLAATAVQTALAGVTLAGTAGLAGAASAAELAVVTLAGAAALTAAGTVSELAAVALAGTASLAAAGTALELAAVTFVAAAALAAGGTATETAAVALVAAATLTAAGTTSAGTVTTVTLAAAAVLAAAGQQTVRAVVALQADTLLAVAAGDTPTAAVHLAALAVLVAAASTLGPVTADEIVAAQARTLLAVAVLRAFAVAAQPHPTAPAATTRQLAVDAQSHPTAAEAPAL